MISEKRRLFNEKSVNAFANYKKDIQKMNSDLAFVVLESLNIEFDKYYHNHYYDKDFNPAVIYTIRNSIDYRNLIEKNITLLIASRLDIKVNKDSLLYFDIKEDASLVQKLHLTKVDMMLTAWILNKEEEETK